MLSFPIFPISSRKDKIVEILKLSKMYNFNYLQKKKQRYNLERSAILSLCGCVRHRTAVIELEKTRVTNRMDSRHSSKNEMEREERIFTTGSFLPETKARSGGTNGDCGVARRKGRRRRERKKAPGLLNR